MNAEGKDIISLAIGSPDMPPSEQTIEKLCEVAHDPNAHGYQPTQGTPELREAMADFYRRWYNVDLDPKSEVLPLIGSKEGILHVTLAFVSGRSISALLGFDTTRNRVKLCLLSSMWSSSTFRP